MSNHDASAQALGYLYQTQCALLLLLKSDDSDIKICVEKFDDISFHKNDKPENLLQIKYHSNKGNITNSSIDFWRTLKVWIDSIKKDSQLLEKTSFCIITTNSISENSIIEKIRGKTESIDYIYNNLRKIAEEGRKTIKSDSLLSKCYDTFINFDSSLVQGLINKINITPDFVRPSEVNEKILQKIKICTTQKNENTVFERLMGWWYKKMIECLESIEPVFISYNELRSELFYITSELNDDNLPNDVTQKEIEAIKKTNDVKTLIFQLEIIDSKSQKINNALKNYYQSYAQRSKWLRENLISPDEIDDYDTQLSNEWEYQFSEITDNIDNKTPDIQKKEMGKELYNILMNQNIPIRKNVNDKTISRGSFNGLANEKKIGWHPDYEQLIIKENNNENLEI